MSSNNKPSGCGCANIPISLILILLGGSYWGFNKYGMPKIKSLKSQISQEEVTSTITPTPDLPASPIVNNPDLPSSPVVNSPQSSTQDTLNNLPNAPIVKTQPKTNQVTANSSQLPTKIPSSKKENTAISPQPISNWEQKKLRGIYFSRYQITNNASEKAIRARVKYYKSQGINTLIHGVWGNACTMYKSEVMQETLGFSSCPNLFRKEWLNWLIDEAHKQEMQVHAYFEKGIKIDENSPIFDLAVTKKWLVPGVDRTYAGVEHYVLDVENPEVANFFRNILVEFVQKYPAIDAVQWDDYLGYHAELPGKIDRTASLTQFVQNIITAMKQANPRVSFDICHHNPYWAKRYFAADWQKWGVDRIFIQAYNEKGFKAELNYAQQYDGVAITDAQFHRLPQLLADQAIESILVFPLSGKPEATAAELKNLTQKSN